MSRFSRHYLTSQFYRGVDAASVPERAKALRIPRPVYDAYVDLYRQSVRLAVALRNVIEDGEHCLAMEEAAAQGHRLPDLAEFSEELRQYIEFLNSFDPYGALSSQSGEILLPYRTAQNLLAMVHYNCLMLSRVLMGCFETDYMKHFKKLKEDLIPYAGPTALQEAVDLIGGLARARTQHESARVPRPRAA